MGPGLLEQPGAQALSWADGAASLATGARACGAWKPVRGEWLSMVALGPHLTVLVIWNAFPCGMICCMVISEGCSMNSPVMERYLYPHITNERPEGPRS